MVHKSNTRSREQSEEKNDVKPIIKREKLEERVLHPMSYYADNRLELVKQVFGTLKPKTIRNLAPEHIREEVMEQLEATVLNELMCISTKRLRSIINCARCPTDTESDDSDVEHQEEHVSLEEISSDSDIDNKKKGKEKTKHSKTTTAQQVNIKKENDKGSKVSILELLELQARARAIRSQLALEPAQTIDLEAKTTEDEPPKVNGKIAPMNGKTAESSNEAEVAEVAESSVVVAPPAKFRLQRNYRLKSPSKVETKEVEATVVPEPTKEETDRRRSASPDVIPIIAEPETLVIDSSSESEEKTMPNKRQASVAKQKEPLAKVTRLSDAEEGEILDEEENAEKAKDKLANDEEKKEVEDEEKKDQEECENEERQENDPSIIDNKDEQQIASTTTTTITTEIMTTTTPTSPRDTVTSDVATTTIPTTSGNNESSELNEKSTVEMDKEIIENEANTESASDENVQPIIDADDKTNVKPTEASADDDSDEGNATEDDDEDDIISLGGGDLEMIDSDAVDCVEQQLNMEYDDIISLDSSGDELIKDEEAASAADAAAAAVTAASWQDRYEKSKKVNKVLTASRLNKRVREKLMAQKREIKAAAEEANAKAKADALKREKKNMKVFLSRHADGTVEQYKELLAMQTQERKNK